MACFSRYSDVKSIRRFDRDLIRVQPGLASGSDRIARTHFCHNGSDYLSCPYRRTTSGPGRPIHKGYRIGAPDTVLIRVPALMTSVASSRFRRASSSTEIGCGFDRMNVFSDIASDTVVIESCNGCTSSSERSTIRVKLEIAFRTDCACLPHWSGVE